MIWKLYAQKQTKDFILNVRTKLVKKQNAMPLKSTEILESQVLSKNGMKSCLK